MPHPPYSPNVAPSDYHLFRSLQNHLNGKTINSNEAVKNALIQFFASKNETFYESGIITVYMIIGNLPPHLRSTTTNAQLVLLCLEKHVIEFGWDIVLKRLIEHLNILANFGITLSFSGKTVRFKETVVFMLEDNLGSHQIGGLTENFSKSIFFCRFCEILRSQLQTNGYS